MTEEFFGGQLAKPFRVPGGCACSARRHHVAGKIGVRLGRSLREASDEALDLAFEYIEPALPDLRRLAEQSQKHKEYHWGLV